MKSIYLDYAASTPVDPLVLKAMKPYFSEKFGNAGSIHSYGQEAMAALDYSRETIAKSIGANFNEIIFTSSATEANNLALRNVNKGSRIIVSSIEHESVLETVKDLESQGVEVVYIPVNGSGIIDLSKLKKAINERTELVSIMYANNEVGSIQPIAEIAKVIRQYKDKNGQGPKLHTDAVQAFQYLDCNVNNIHVDMMTLSSHKIYGPKGAGALYVRNLEFLKPILAGGGQEFGFRSSTENIPAIVGFAKAAEIAQGIREKESERVSALRDYLWKNIKRIYPKAQINGSIKERLPNNLNIYLPGMRSEDLIIKLDLRGIAVSSGSACEARSLEPSYVIEALGFSKKRAMESIRITLGRPVQKRDIDNLLSAIKNIVKTTI